MTVYTVDNKINRPHFCFDEGQIVTIRNVIARQEGSFVLDCVRGSASQYIDPGCIAVGRFLASDYLFVYGKEWILYG